MKIEGKGNTRGEEEEPNLKEEERGREGNKLNPEIREQDGNKETNGRYNERKQI